MPFNGTTKRFDRIWSFVSQFVAMENARRSDFDVSHNDIKDSINAAIAYLEGLIAAITGGDVRFLGYQASDPATRVGGGALVSGDFYVNSTTKDFRFYNGTAFIRGLDLPIATAFFKTLFAAADAASLRGLIGLGSASVQNATAFATATQGTKADAAVLASGGIANNVTDWQSIQTTGCGFYEGAAGALNAPSVNPSFGIYVKQSATRGFALVADSLGSLYRNNYESGVWSGWRSVVSLANAGNIINGNFGLWKRSTSITASGYAADRFRMDKSGGTVTFSRQSFALGDMIGSHAPIYYGRVDVTGQSAAGDFATLAQRIEGVRTYSGRTITLLGWARRASGAGNMAIEMTQNFGTGGSPSAPVNIAPVSITLSTLWLPFAASFAIPSIAGKTLGSSGNSYLQATWWTSAGSNFNARTNSLGIQTLAVDFWGLHLVPEIVSADFTSLYVPRGTVDNELDCLRFYRTGETCMSGNVTSGSLYRARAQFVPEMRAAPTVVLTSIVDESFPTTTASAGEAVDGFVEQRTADATGAGTFRSTYTADAEL